MYQATVAFIDITDIVDGKAHRYGAGDNFPRKGAKADAERIEYLLSAKNRMGQPVIKEIKAKTKKEG